MRGNESMMRDINEIRIISIRFKYRGVFIER